MKTKDMNLTITFLSIKKNLTSNHWRPEKLTSIQPCTSGSTPLRSFKWYDDIRLHKVWSLILLLSGSIICEYFLNKSCPFGEFFDMEA
jgi:hypothetical protein